MSNFTTILCTLLSEVMRAVDRTFYVHLIINMAINAAVLPLVNQWSVVGIMDARFSYGVSLFMAIAVIEGVASVHSAYFLEPSKSMFDAVSHQVVERFTLARLEKLSHCSQKKLLDGIYTDRRNAVKWTIKSFMQQLVNSAIQAIPLAGYVLWIGYSSPFTVILYCAGIGAYMKYTEPETITWDAYHAHWVTYNRYRHNQYSELIHGRGDSNHAAMAQAMYDCELLSGKDRSFSVGYAENINVIFNAITVANCAYVLLGSDDGSFIILYIQYIRLLRSNLQMVSELYKQYKESEKEFSRFEEIFKDSVDRADDEPVMPFNNEILIKRGSHYIRDSKVALMFNDPVVLKRGHVTYISGPSGAGKTTLLDVIGGIIRHRDTHFKILIDGVKARGGFGHLKSMRIYVATDIAIRTSDTTVYEIVTTNRGDIDGLVWSALRFAECTDFVTTETLHQRDISLSKGQINRLKVARYMYDILTFKPAIVLMDEIADGVDAETTVKIAESIYRYFRESGIMCLVTTHLTALQELRYDNTIHIASGIVTI